MLRIDPQAYFFWALLLLLLPLDWLFAAAVAAIFHELCHIVVLKIQGGRIHSIHVHWNGCVIDVDRMQALHQFISILAGPIGSLSLLSLCRSAPKIAVCGFIQGIYNLIPLMPLDGGRLLREILYCICPEKSEEMMLGVELFLRIAIVTSIFLMIGLRLLGPVPGIILVILNIRLTLRKFPCKPFKIGVQ